MKIDFGTMTPPISRQLRNQDLKFDGEKMRYFEKMRECISSLRFVGIVTEKQSKVLHGKLLVKIKQRVKAKN